MEEFTCPACGDTYHSPISATLCADRDDAEDRENRARFTPREHVRERYYRSED